MNLSGFSWHVLGSVLSFSVTVSELFCVKAPHTPSERHLSGTIVGRDIKLSQYKSLPTGSYHQPLPANSCPGHTVRHHRGSISPAPQRALTPASLRALWVFRIHAVGAPGSPSCWAPHFVPASIKTYSGLIYPAWQLIWIMLWIFHEVRPVLINRCLLRKQDHK